MYQVFPLTPIVPWPPSSKLIWSHQALTPREGSHAVSQVGLLPLLHSLPLISFGFICLKTPMKCLSCNTQLISHDQHVELSRSPTQESELCFLSTTPHTPTRDIHFSMFCLRFWVQPCHFPHHHTFVLLDRHRRVGTSHRCQRYSSWPKLSCHTPAS